MQLATLPSFPYLIREENAAITVYGIKQALSSCKPNLY